MSGPVSGKHSAAISNTAPLLLSIEDAATVLGIGRTLMYGLVAAGEVRSIPIGRRRLVPVTALEEYVEERLRGQSDIVVSPQR